MEKYVGPSNPQCHSAGLLTSAKSSMPLFDSLQQNGGIPSAAPRANTNVTQDIVGARGAPKQFLVFDQTGNKTTLIFRFGNDTSWNLKVATGRDGDYDSGPNLTDELNEDLGTNDNREMQEDTDEINALLYSDEENEDDEVTSTDHSPSTMTAYVAEEVASSSGPTKRRKLSYGYVPPSVSNTDTSAKPGKPLNYSDDAESSCARLTSLDYGDVGSEEDRIQDTVSILQTMIPGGKGKDAIAVLDEAIRYLKSLKTKAESLGISAL